jgi:murein DD-endopeptidase MepM/ murein hydrolase activator NlpD
MTELSASGGTTPLTRRDLRARDRVAGARPSAPDATRARRRPAVSVGAALRGVAARVLPVGAMLFVGALVAGMSIPAQAVPSTASAGQAGLDRRTVIAGTQSLTVSAAAVEGVSARDGYTWTDLVAEAAKAKAAALAKAAKSGSGDASAGEPSTSGVSFIPAPGPVLWPTDVSPQAGKGVTNSHRGQDLLMAGGTPVHAIADGVVLTSTTQGSYGQYVVIQSTVGGHTVTSLYAHMQLGSSPVTAGQTVTAGTTIGLVGSTGAATANLLYLRIVQDGQLVDTITYISGNPAGGAAPH